MFVLLFLLSGAEKTAGCAEAAAWLFVREKVETKKVL